jgi:phosphate transport system substrate-binding protein
MNDDFLQRLREQPPAELQARLKARLDDQPYQRQRSLARRTSYFVAAALLGGVAIVAIAPVVRNALMADRETVSFVSVDAKRLELPGTTPEVATPVRQASGASSQRPAIVPVDYNATTLPRGAIVGAPRVTMRASCAGNVCELAHALDQGFALASGPSLTIDASSDATGFGKLCSRQIDVLFASRPIDKSEMVNCTSYGTTYYELPVAHEAAAVVVPRNNAWLDALTLEQLQSSWSARPYWSGFNSEWPKQQAVIITFGGDMRPAMNLVAGILGVAPSHSSAVPSAINVSEVSRSLSRFPGTIGVVSYEFSRKHTDTLRAVQIEREGKPVAASFATVRDGSYPLSRTVFLYVGVQNAELRPEVVQLATAVVRASDRTFEASGLIAPSDPIRRIDLEILNLGEVGTVFNGEVANGMNVERALTTNERKSYF